MRTTKLLRILAGGIIFIVVGGWFMGAVKENKIHEAMVRSEVERITTAGEVFVVLSSNGPNRWGRTSMNYADSTSTRFYHETDDPNWRSLIP